MAENGAGQTPEELKAIASERAATLVEDGMVVGLGSGTTSALVVAAIGKRVEQEGLRLVGVPTSERTAEIAGQLHIPLSTLADHPHLDIAIDGADEVELGSLQLIKGGGGNLLREKLIAIAAARFVIVVDDRKLVQKLGTRFPLPIEVVPFGWQTTERRLRDLGAEPVLRKQDNGDAYVTDGGHYILDCRFGAIDSPAGLAQSLDGVVGVVEHGLFLDMTSEVIVGKADGIDVIHPKAKPTAAE